MAIAKKNLFTIEENRIADLAKAIAHPARVSILLYLIKKNNCEKKIKKQLSLLLWLLLIKPMVNMV